MSNLNPNRSVHVVNNNIFDHTETFKGNQIHIPKNGGKVKMLREEAVMFKSQFYQPIYDGDGVQKVESYKKLTLEEIPEEMVKDLPPAASSKNVCMACGKKCQSLKDLKAHVKDSPGCAAKLIDEDAQKEIFGE